MCLYMKNPGQRIIIGLLVAIAVSVAGCSSSATNDSAIPDFNETSETSETSDSSSDAIDQIANDASLSGSVLDVQETIINRSLLAISNLNRAYTSGTLAAERINCIDEDAGFPVLQYYCGEAGVGERLADFGFPAFALSVEDSQQCRNSIINNDTVANCNVTFSDSELAGEWFVTYSSADVEGVQEVSMRLSDGIVPEFVELEDNTSVCEIKISDQTDFDYSDESTCRVTVAQISAILLFP